jgi:uncharacterized membrane protein
MNPVPDGPFRRCRDGLGSASMPTEQLILLIAPIVLIQLALMIVALVDLERDERKVRGGRKVVWALIIVFVSIIGPILYFTVGREEA